MPLLGGPTCPVRGATGGQGCPWRHDDSMHGPSAPGDHDDSRMTSYFTTPIPWYSVSVRHCGVWVPCDHCLGAQWAHSHTPCAPTTPWLTPYAPHWPYVVPMKAFDEAKGLNHLPRRFVSMNGYLSCRLARCCSMVAVSSLGPCLSSGADTSSSSSSWCASLP